MSKGTRGTANSFLCLVANFRFQPLSRLLQLARWLWQRLHLLLSFLVWLTLCVQQTLNCSLAFPIDLLQKPIDSQKWSNDQERKRPNARSNHPRMWLSSNLSYLARNVETSFYNAHNEHKLQLLQKVLVLLEGIQVKRNLCQKKLLKHTKAWMLSNHYL